MAAIQFELSDGEVQRFKFTMILSKYTNPGPTSVPSSNTIARPVIVVVGGSKPYSAIAAAISAWTFHESIVQPAALLGTCVAALQPKKATQASPLASVRPMYQRGASAR